MPRRTSHGRLRVFLQQLSHRSTPTRDFGGNLFSIRPVMAGVGVGYARITLFASTRTGIPWRPRAGRFRESIAGQRYQAVGLLEFDGYNMSDVIASFAGQPNGVPIQNV